MCGPWVIARVIRMPMTAAQSADKRSSRRGRPSTGRESRAVCSQGMPTRPFSFKPLGYWRRLAIGRPSPGFLGCKLSVFRPGAYGAAFTWANCRA